MRTLRSPLTQKKTKVEKVEKDMSYKSDMIGLPGTKFREKVDKEVNDYIAKHKAKVKAKVEVKPTAPTKQLKSATKKVSAKTAYNIKKASDQKLTASARKHYAENAQAAMKNKKSPAPKMKKC